MATETNPILNLIVLKSQNPDRLAEFYELLGLTFIKHRHGNGPEHYAAEIGSSVFEIYPRDETSGGNNLGRIGFQVPDLDGLIERLTSEGTIIVSPPKSSPWGYRAVVQDPDGLKVELVSEVTNA